ncbi:unnamed protein product [Discula destructiva]
MQSFSLILVGLVPFVVAGLSCGVSHGYDLGTNAYFYSGDGSLANFDACSAKCQSDSKCLSFAFGNKECLLYAAALDTNFRAQSNSPYLFYDRDCVKIQATSSFPTSLPPAAPTAAPAAPSSPSTPGAPSNPQTTSSSDSGSGTGTGSGGSGSGGTSGGDGTGASSSSPTSAAGSSSGGSAGKGGGSGASAAADMTSGLGAKSTGHVVSQSGSGANASGTAAASGEASTVSGTVAVCVSSWVLGAVGLGALIAIGI